MKRVKDETREETFTRDQPRDDDSLHWDDHDGGGEK